MGVYRSESSLLYRELSLFGNSSDAQLDYEDGNFVDSTNTVEELSNNSNSNTYNCPLCKSNSMAPFIIGGIMCVLLVVTITVAAYRAVCCKHWEQRDGGGDDEDDEEEEISVSLYDFMRTLYENSHAKNILRERKMRSKLVANALIVMKPDTVFELSLTSALDSGMKIHCRRNSSIGDEENCLNSSNVDQSKHKSTPRIDSSTEKYLALENPMGSTNWRVDSCAICLESYTQYDSISYSKHQRCMHAFHTNCIVPWLLDEKRSDCPCCRGPYLEVEVNVGEDDKVEANAHDNEEHSNTDIDESDC